MNLRSTVAAVAIAVGASLGAAVVAVAPATPVSAHGDACTNAPDSGPYWNFHSSCHTHDSCYANKPYGNSQWGRLQCDNNFRNNMRRSCDDRYAWYNPLRYSCRDVANIYAVAVIAAGWYYWD